jgi:hypothetical protein
LDKGIRDQDRITDENSKEMKLTALLVVIADGLIPLGVEERNSLGLESEICDQSVYSRKAGIGRAERFGMTPWGKKTTKKKKKSAACEAKVVQWFNNSECVPVVRVGYRKREFLVRIPGANQLADLTRLHRLGDSLGMDVVRLLHQ